MDSHKPEAERLRQDVEWALRRAIDPSDVLPMLHRLARTAVEGTDESIYAHRNLAELLVERNPWRAALHARRLLSHRPEDDRGWAMLGLCQTLLGNFRFAASAYHRALTRSPSNPWYAHNLGHLLDVALGRAKAALPWLKSAHAAAPTNSEIATSYAHALARAGNVPEAKKVLARAIKKGMSREHAALLRWLDNGAPPGKDQPSPRPAPIPRRPRRSADAIAPAAARPRQAAGKNAAPEAAELDRALARGLASLPLDARQRGRAKELARDALAHFLHESSRVTTATAGAQSLAAAIAYAIVYVDHVPLTQAEVAACFRVSVASVRGRFGELRTCLDLTPGDARYATVRRR